MSEKIVWQGDDHEVKAEYRFMEVIADKDAVHGECHYFNVYKLRRLVTTGLHFGSIKTAMVMAELAAREYAGQ
jgi:hypothetical protein